MVTMKAIGMPYPGELYSPSSNPYRGLDDLRYPFHDRTITVTNCGRMCFGKRKINLSLGLALAGQNMGVKEVSDKIWMISSLVFLEDGY